MTIDFTTNLKQCRHKENCIHPEKIGNGRLPATNEYFQFRKDTERFRNECKVCQFKKTKEDAQRRKKENPSKFNKQSANRTAKYRNKNRKLVLERTRQWKKENREHISNYNKWYRKTKPDKGQKSHEKRSQRLQSLPRNFNQSDWKYALEYFSYKCAICGKSKDDGIVLSPDHWIPLAHPQKNNPGTVPNNIIPLCYGENGCQGSKHALDPIIWVKRLFNEQKGLEILAKIQSFFETTRKA